MSSPAPRLLHAPGSNLQAGTGERRDDCRRLEACLDGWVRGCIAFGIKTDPPAHCASGCPTWEPRKTAAALDEIASARRSA